MTFMTHDEQVVELARITKAMKVLIVDAAGCYPTDHGHYPTALVQAELRFDEASLWLSKWIESQNPKVPR